jgi:hypothetical protein
VLPHLPYSNLSQKNRKKMKFPSSMINGRFHPPKCRSKAQKTREETPKGIFLILLPTFFNWCGQLLLVGYNIACLTQTSPKIFIFPLLFICRSKNYEVCTPVKLILRHMFTKSFKKSKKNLTSNDVAQTPNYPP